MKKKIRLKERHSRSKRHLEEKTETPPQCTRRSSSRSAPRTSPRGRGDTIRIQDSTPRHIHRKRIECSLKMLRFLKLLKSREIKLKRSENVIADKRRETAVKIRRYRTQNDELQEREKKLEIREQNMMKKYQKIEEELHDKELKLQQREKEVASKIGPSSHNPLVDNDEKKARSPHSSSSPTPPTYSEITSNRSSSTTSLSSLQDFESAPVTNLQVVPWKPSSLRSLLSASPDANISLSPDNRSSLIDPLPATSRDPNILSPRRNQSSPSPLPSTARVANISPLRAVNVFSNSTLPQTNTSIKIRSGNQKDQKIRKSDQKENQIIRKKWSKSYAIDDVVLGKYRQYPFWPAVVRAIITEPKPTVEICWFPLEKKYDYFQM